MAEAGYFPIFIDKNKGYCIDVEGGHMRNGTKIILYQYHGGRNQLWHYDGTYIRSAADSNYVIDVDGGHYRNGRKLQIWKFNGSHAQHWNIEKNMIISRGNSKFCIDLHNATIKNCQKIHLIERRSGGHPAQFWTWAKPAAKKAARKAPAKAKKKKQTVKFLGVSWGIEDTIMRNTAREITIKTGFNNQSTSELENNKGSTNSSSNSSSRESTNNFEWSVDASASGGFFGCDFSASAHTGGSNSQTNSSSKMSAREATNMSRQLNSATRTSYGEKTLNFVVNAENVDTYILTARIRGEVVETGEIVSIHTGAHRRWPCDEKPFPAIPPFDSLI